ncbi:hypothetical protein N7448_009349 [Penicillium atrosanguineum]|uniref:Uncharacterized protein n=1 Tax=Penicillium atrosanguineum TaxID=1132637 RepID=A0A9W9Q0D2_9EURO|nr:hypothetical protein N7448_009349 [Penicillium atrosanguineum]KAJ5321255.1 hypothetical protein N7476_004257 [Penicillium atrosanguineum]
MASQWPKPEGFDGDIDPFDLVDRFKEHFLSICRYTADNPTAIAPASYVMETMFQANKVVAVLAKNLSDVSNARFPEPRPEPEPEQPPSNQLSLQDRLAALSNMFEVKQEEPTEEPSAGVEEADEVAQELSTMDIFGPDLNPEDSEEDGDWGSESSEDDSDDDFYEYGSFRDDSEEEEEGEEGEEEEDSEAQEDATILVDDEDMGDECEDEVAEEENPPAEGKDYQHHDSIPEIDQLCSTEL